MNPIPENYGTPFTPHRRLDGWSYFDADETLHTGLTEEQVRAACAGKGGGMKIYIASKTAHAPRWRALRGLGHPIISTWIDEAGKGESRDLEDLAIRCIQEACEADVTILYCERGELLKGALIEAGAALARGNRVFCVGTCSSISPVLAMHPQWTEWSTIEAALKEAGKGQP